MSRPRCDVCRKFPAQVVRQNRQDYLRPSQCMCRFCREDPAMPPNSHETDYALAASPRELECDVCGHHFPLREDFLYVNNSVVCQRCVPHVPPE